MRVGESAEIAELRARLPDPDESVRLNAALDLAALGSADGAGVLIEALGHPWSVVRRSFARPALVKLGDSVMPELEDALERLQLPGAVGAAVALVEIDERRRDDALPLLRRALAEGGEPARDALMFLWERLDLAARLHDELLRLARSHADADESPEADARVHAAAVASRLDDRDGGIHALLVSLLERDEDELRWAGALGLGRAGVTSPHAVEALARLVSDDEPHRVRHAAAHALARLGDPASDTVPALRSLLASSSVRARVTALRVLGELGSSEARHRSDDTIFAWVYSAHSLAHALDPDELEPLITPHLADDDVNVVRNAVLALSWLGPAASGAIQRLADLLGRPYFGGLAAEALARIGDAARPVLSEAARGEDVRAAHARYALSLLGDSPGEAFAPDLRDFYLEVPIQWTDEKRAAFEELYRSALAHGPGTEVAYDLPYPRHEFLRYLCDVHRLLAHGSVRGDLSVLRPLRSSTDVSEHGNVSGVYAEPDPIRPIYFAVLERRYTFGLVNTCFAVAEDGDDDTRLERTDLPRFYRLSIGALSDGNGVWRDGTIYMLPREPFRFWEEWTSRVPVEPVLKIAVGPDDLPLKDDLWYTDLRKLGDIWVDPEQPFPYLEDVWALPIRTLPRVE